MKMFCQFRIWLYLVLIAVLAVGCGQQEFVLTLDENSPVQTMRNATIQYTDSGRLQMIMWGEEILNFDDEDETQEFPSYVKATFFDDDGDVTVIITADEGTNWQKKQLMNLRKNVIIVDLKQGTRTYTEDFFWDQDKAEIYSNVPVLRINSDGTRQRGTGFRSDEQMENFVIFNPRFEIIL
jgi:LPS export ABC transporter protein LptC